MDGLVHSLGVVILDHITFIVYGFYEAFPLSFSPSLRSSLPWVAHRVLPEHGESEELCGPRDGEPGDSRGGYNTADRCHCLY